MSEGLAQGPYVAARAGVEPMTLRSKGFDSIIAPPRPTITSAVIKNLLQMSDTAQALHNHDILSFHSVTCTHFSCVCVFMFILLPVHIVSY